jgi:hypothetical protein
MRELPIPPGAKQDPESVEIVRVWVASEQQHVSLKIGTWTDATIWGMLLCDLAKHFANAHYQESGVDYEQALAQIRAGFDAEMDFLTDSPKGTIIGN